MKADSRLFTIDIIILCRIEMLWQCRGIYECLLFNLQRYLMHIYVKSLVSRSPPACQVGDTINVNDIFIKISLIHSFIPASVCVCVFIRIFVE
jgi:hypothetical protein